MTAVPRSSPLHLFQHFLVKLQLVFRVSLAVVALRVFVMEGLVLLLQFVLGRGVVPLLLEVGEYFLEGVLGLFLLHLLEVHPAEAEAADLEGNNEDSSHPHADHQPSVEVTAPA